MAAGASGPTCRPGPLDDHLPAAAGPLEYCTPDNHDGWLREFRQVGRIAAEVAMLAAERDIIIVQAAGNDSDPNLTTATGEARHFCPEAIHPCDGWYPIRAESTSEFAWAAARWGTLDLPMTRAVDGTPALTNPILIAEALAPDGSMLPMSNIGGDIAAPGGRIHSTFPGHGHGWMSGTSQAAPHVTAAVGYLRAFNPALTNAQVRDALLGYASPAVPMSSPQPQRFSWTRPLRHGVDLDGNGIVDAHGAADVMESRWEVELDPPSCSRTGTASGSELAALSPAATAVASPMRAGPAVAACGYPCPPVGRTFTNGTAAATTSSSPRASRSRRRVPLTPKPGVYVLKGEIDPHDLVEESDEGNNLSYALFEVTSDGHVDLLERGYGSSPWDRGKTVSTVSP